MNREIKFKAWDVERKILINWEDLCLEWNYGETSHLPSDIILMQFTGIIDRTGVEIYEGDIVRIQHPHGGDFSDTKGEVYYWEVEGAFYHGNLAGRPPKRLWDYCEVIGNIYENPELLDTK